MFGCILLKYPQALLIILQGILLNGASCIQFAQIYMIPLDNIYIRVYCLEFSTLAQGFHPERSFTLRIG